MKKNVLIINHDVDEAECTIKLPIKRDANGIVYDETHEFSDDGYIPDWEWMDGYMKSLPYSDRI